MKKLILSAIAATLVASPMVASVAEAAPQQRTVTTVKERPNGRTVVTTRTTETRGWRAGQRFEQDMAHASGGARNHHLDHFFSPAATTSVSIDFSLPFSKMMVAWRCSLCLPPFTRL